MICTLRILLMTAAIGSAAGASEPRQTISLDGSWQIAEGTMAAVPQKFERVVPVPGLVDLAQPPFEKPGPSAPSPRGQHVREADRLREAFWYRRSFDLPQTLPAVVQLKVHKARYGTAVWLNGRRIGEHLPCFTPGWFDLAGAARPGHNEILIRIGSSPAALPASVVDGHDHEKIRYIPGIFDSVEVILTGAPHLVNVQVAPDVENGSARVAHGSECGGESRPDGAALYRARVEVGWDRRSARGPGGVDGGTQHADGQRGHSAAARPALVARRPVPLRVRSNYRRRHPCDPFRHAVVRAETRRRAGGRPSLSERENVLLARQ